LSAQTYAGRRGCAARAALSSLTRSDKGSASRSFPRKQPPWSDFFALHPDTSHTSEEADVGEVLHQRALVELHARHPRLGNGRGKA
ncbi:MAG: hypothetical protein ACXVH1_36975, partial [Solirubrobacteraceae bacterium]